MTFGLSINVINVRIGEFSIVPICRSIDQNDTIALVHFLPVHLMVGGQGAFEPLSRRVESERAAKWLPICVKDGSNRQARWEMMMAALEGGMCLQKSLGAAHALGTPLGELHLHHGTLIGILLPHVLKFNAEASDHAFARIRQAANIPDEQLVHDWLSDFVSGIGLPTRLSDLGVDPKILPDIAQKAMADHLTASNPRTPKSADYIDILTDAM